MGEITDRLAKVIEEKERLAQLLPANSEWPDHIIEELVAIDRLIEKQHAGK